MNGEVKWTRFRDFGERAQDAAQLAWIIDIGGSMQGHKAEAAAIQTQTYIDAGLASCLDVEPQRIDHEIADEMDPVRRNSLGQEVAAAAFLGDEQEIGNGIGHDAVDLLRHGAIETAESG